MNESTKQKHNYKLKPFTKEESYIKTPKKKDKL